MTKNVNTIRQRFASVKILLLRMVVVKVGLKRDVPMCMVTEALAEPGDGIHQIK
jgi:hypothetical protein